MVFTFTSLIVCPSRVAEGVAVDIVLNDVEGSAVPVDNVEYAAESIPINNPITSKLGIISLIKWFTKRKNIIYRSRLLVM